MRTEVSLDAVYRQASRQLDVPDIRDPWLDDCAAFPINPGITLDQALEEADVYLTRDHRSQGSALPTAPANRFRSPAAVTKRRLAAEQAIVDTPAATCFPFNHGAPLRHGVSEAI